MCLTITTVLFALLSSHRCRRRPTHTCPANATRQWQVHRVLRPEAYGGLLHNTLKETVVTPLPASILDNVVST